MSNRLRFPSPQQAILLRSLLGGDSLRRIERPGMTPLVLNAYGSVIHRRVWEQALDHGWIRIAADGLVITEDGRIALRRRAYWLRRRTW